MQLASDSPWIGRVISNQVSEVSFLSRLDQRVVRCEVSFGPEARRVAEPTDKRAGQPPRSRQAVATSWNPSHLGQSCPQNRARTLERWAAWEAGWNLTIPAANCRRAGDGRRSRWWPVIRNRRLQSFSGQPGVARIDVLSCQLLGSGLWPAPLAFHLFPLTEIREVFQSRERTPPRRAEAKIRRSQRTRSQFRFVWWRPPLNPRSRPGSPAWRPPSLRVHLVSGGGGGTGQVPIPYISRHHPGV